MLAKPDITGSDCGINTYFGSFDGTHWRFCGTSAAAPHTAAVAALLLQQNPDLTPAQLNAALISTADDLGFPAGTQGTGLVDAAAAGAAAPDAQTITFAQPAKGAVGGSRTLHATASSGLAVTFKVDAAPAPAGACTLSGSHNATVHYVKAGSCVIDAKQAGSALFTAAPQVKRTIVVKSAPAVSTKSLPAGTVHKKYTATLHSTGGNVPVTWAVRAASCRRTEAVEVRCDLREAHEGGHLRRHRLGNRFERADGPRHETLHDHGPPLANLTSSSSA